MACTWGDRGTRHPAQKWVEWVKVVAGHEGVVTFDMGPNWNPQAGPIGSLAQPQVDQVKAIKAAVERMPGRATTRPARGTTPRSGHP